MQEENLETKQVSWSVYKIYAKSVGLSLTLWVLVLMIVNQVLSVGTNFWLAEWSDDPDSSIPSVRDTYLGKTYIRHFNHAT